LAGIVLALLLGIPGILGAVVGALVLIASISLITLPAYGCPLQAIVAVMTWQELS
jgi:hypothetical protein